MCICLMLKCGGGDKDGILIIVTCLFWQYHRFAWTLKKKKVMNKMGIHGHVIFRHRNAMFSLSNTYVFPDWQR